MVFNLSTNKNELGSRYGRSELMGEEFRAFWKSLDKVTTTAKEQIQADVSAGIYMDVDMEPAARQICALIESPLYHRRISWAKALQNAELAATLVLQSPLRDPSVLQETRELAAELDHKPK